MAFQFSQTGQELQYLANEVTQLAGDYDETASYAIGDYCNYQGTVYRCTAATTGTFDASDWTSSVIVMDAIKALKARMTTAEGNISTAQGNITTLQTSVGNIGTILTAHNASAVTVTKENYTSVCSLTLPAGTWVVMGKARFNGHSASAFTVFAGLSGSASNISVDNDAYYPEQIGASFTNGFIGITSGAMFKTTTSRTVYFVIYEGATNSVSVPIGQASISAIRIA